MMLRTIEAVIEPDGQVRLLEPLTLETAHRALVTVLDEPGDVAGGSGSGLFSKDPGVDWGREEDAAAWVRDRSGESQLRGLSNEDLRSLAGTISAGDLDIMGRVIEEEFERIDPHGW